MNNMHGLLLLVLVALLTGMGQLCFKSVALRCEPLLRKIVRPLFLLGVSLFLLCPILSSVAAKSVDYSVLYGMTALNYPVVLALSRVFMRERLDRCKIGGVAVIIAGLVVMLTG